MKRVKPKTLAGFQDLLPATALAQEEIVSKLKKIFTSFGYAPIETPHLEYFETLIQETEGEIGKQLFRFEDNGGRDVCLRFDLTLPLARYVVQHQNELGRPFKRYAIGNCFRGERPQFGRYREFLQCDFDILGVDSLCAEAEILQVWSAGFKDLDIGKFCIKLNNRKLLNAFAESLGVANPIELIRLLDKSDKIPEEKFIAELRQLGCDSERVNSFVKATSLDELEGLVSSEAYGQGLAELKELFGLLDGAVDLILDPALARGFGYYTGHVFEVSSLEVPEVGSLGGGGRYDNLTQTFSSDSMPGVGASFGVSRILALLDKLGKLGTATSPAQVLLSNLDLSLTPKVFALAKQLRTEGINVEVYPDPVKLKKQIQYADRKGIPFVVLYGEEEAVQNIYQLKELDSGEQVTCESTSDLIQKIRKV